MSIHFLKGTIKRLYNYFNSAALTYNMLFRVFFWSLKFKFYIIYLFAREIKFLFCILPCSEHALSILMGLMFKNSSVVSTIH